MTIATDSVYLANMHTSKGNIVIRLNPAQAPITVNNFVFLARAGFYNGLRFHRVIPRFVIQGGDPRGTGQGGPGYTFQDELPPAGSYRIGSVAMANAGPDTNGSQFFIITGPQGVGLPPSYSLFGRVISGMSVARKIAQAPRRANDAPRPPIIIRRIAVGVA
jgi:peptidylprolyl isomerase